MFLVNPPQRTQNWDVEIDNSFRGRMSSEKDGMNYDTQVLILTPMKMNLKFKGQFTFTTKKLPFSGTHF